MTPIPLFTISVILAAHAQALTNTLTLATKPPAGHHFNLKAPMRMEVAGRKSIKPASAAKDEIRFNVVNARAALPFRVTLYVCDDANTYCVKQEQDLEWSGSELRKKALEKSLTKEKQAT